MMGWDGTRPAEAGSNRPRPASGRPAGQKSEANQPTNQQRFRSQKPEHGHGGGFRPPPPCSPNSNMVAIFPP